MCQLTSEDIKHHFTLTTCSVSFPPVSLHRQVVYLLLQPVFVCSSLGRAYTVSWLVYIKVMIMLQQPLTFDSLLMLPTCFLHSPPHSPTYGTPNKCIFSYVRIYRTVKESKTQPPFYSGHITALQDLPAWCWWRDGHRLQQLLQACPHQDTHTHSSSAVALSAPWKETVALLTTVKSKKFTISQLTLRKISLVFPVPLPYL